MIISCEKQVFGHDFPIPNSDCTRCGINQAVLSKSTEPKISEGDRRYARVKEALHKAKNVKYEYQDLGIEMSLYFKGNIWWIFHKYKVHDIRVAFKKRQEEGVYRIDYLLNDLKNV